MRAEAGAGPGRGGWSAAAVSPCFLPVLVNKTRISFPGLALAAVPEPPMPPATEELNPQQRRAVEHGIAAFGAAPAPPLLVIAGAGSGTTKTLAHRVAQIGRASCRESECQYV